MPVISLKMYMNTPNIVLEYMKQKQNATKHLIRLEINTNMIYIQIISLKTITLLQ